MEGWVESTVGEKEAMLILRLIVIFMARLSLCDLPGRN